MRLRSNDIAFAEMHRQQGKSIADNDFLIVSNWKQPAYKSSINKYLILFKSASTSRYDNRSVIKNETFIKVARLNETILKLIEAITRAIVDIKISIKF